MLNINVKKRLTWIYFLSIHHRRIAQRHSARNHQVRVMNFQVKKMPVTKWRAEEIILNSFYSTKNYLFSLPNSIELMLFFNFWIKLCILWIFVGWSYSEALDMLAKLSSVYMHIDFNRSIQGNANICVCIPSEPDSQYANVRLREKKRGLHFDVHFTVHINVITSLQTFSCQCFEIIVIS